MGDKNELNNSLVVHRDTGITKTQEKEKIIEDDAYLAVDHMTEAEQIIKKGNQEKQGSLDDLINTSEKDPFESNIKDILDNDENHLQEDLIDSENNTEVDDLSKLSEQELISHKSTQTEVKDADEKAKKDELSHFMDDLEDEQMSFKKTKDSQGKKRRKMIRKLNNEETETKTKNNISNEEVKMNEKKATAIISRLFSAEKLKHKKASIVKQIIKRLRRPDEIKKGYMDEDGNIIPDFELSEESFRLTEYTDKLNVLQMESDKEIYDHYQKLLKQKDDPEKFALMNKSVQNLLKNLAMDTKDEKNREEDDTSIFSTMSGMQSLKLFEKDRGSYSSTKLEKDQTEKFGLMSVENEFIMYLGKQRVNQMVSKNKEKHGQDDDEDKELNASESFDSEESEKKLVSKQKLLEDGNTNMVDHDHDIADEILKPAENLGNSSEAIDQIVAKENKSMENLNKQQKVKMPRIKKIKDKQIIRDRDKNEEEMESEKKELDVGVDHSSHTTEDTESSEKSSESTDSNKIKKSEKTESKIDKKLNSDLDQLELEDKEELGSNVVEEDKSEKSKESGIKGIEEDESSQTEESMVEDIHEEESGKNEDGHLNNLMTNIDDMGDRFKEIQKDIQDKKDIKEAQEKNQINGSDHMNVDKITNPIQGQPPETMFEENKKKEDKEEQSRSEKSEEEHKSHRKKAENDKFNEIHLEYVVPEMQPISIENYHVGYEAKSIEDYTETEIVEQISQSTRKLTEEKNKNKHHELGRIYRLYKLLPFCVQRAIESCQPKMEKVLDVCMKFHKKDCLEHNYVVRLECMKSETYFNGACYKNCPEDMNDGKIACVKRPVQKRRVENLEDPTKKDNYDIKYADRFLVTECKSFGPSYVSLGPDFCIQECPYGWKDLGKLCVKPFRFKNQKVFFFDSSM